MDLTTIGLIVLGVGVVLIVIAFLVQLAKPSGPGPARDEAAAPRSGPAAVIDAVAGALRAFGEMLEGILGMFEPVFRPGVFLAIIGGLLAVVGAFT